MTAIALLIPFAAVGDSIVLRDGNKFDGTFDGATAKEVAWIESSGNRRTFEVSKIQEIHFGTVVVPPGDTEAKGRPYEKDPFTQDAVNRLRADIEAASHNAQLSKTQLGVLSDSRETLRRAVDDRSLGHEIDRAAVRKALEDVQSVMADSSVRSEDRERVMAGIRQLRYTNAAR
jgi:hypothetical protein